MSEIANALKGEITRLARKEIRLQIEPIKKSHAQTKLRVAEQIVDLQKEVTALKTQIKILTKQLSTLRPSEVNEQIDVQTSVTQSRQRFSAKSLTTLRNRLGLSYDDIGKLVGASGQAVRKWEDGSSVPREKYKLALLNLRTVGKRDLPSLLSD